MNQIWTDRDMFARWYIKVPLLSENTARAIESNVIEESVEQHVDKLKRREHRNRDLNPMKNLDLYLREIDLRLERASKFSSDLSDRYEKPLNSSNSNKKQDSIPLPGDSVKTATTDCELSAKEVQRSYFKGATKASRHGLSSIFTGTGIR